MEVCLVLLVAFSGYVLESVYVVGGHWNPGLPMSNARTSFGIVHELVALILLAYVLSRRSLRFRDLGLRWSLKDIGVGLLVAVVGMLAYVFGYYAIQFIHHRMFGVWAAGPNGRDLFGWPGLAAIPFSLLNPFFEEMIARAYLMTEVAELTGSAALAVLASVGVQFSYHLYQGWAQAISLSFIFLVYALYYARSRRALPVIVAHGLFDIWGLIRLW